MFSERHTRNEQSSNSISWEPTRRELTSIQIASKALATIRDNVRRILVNENSSDESQTSVSANVVTKRNKYPYDANDYSLITNNKTHTPERVLENPIYSEIDEEIQRLRNSLPENDEAGPSRRIIYGGDHRENVLIRVLLQEIRDLRLQLVGPPGNEHANRDGRHRETLEYSNHSLKPTSESTKKYVINQDLTFIWIFNIKRSENDTGIWRQFNREFINAASYAMKSIHPADEQTLLGAILCTKFKEKAMVNFHTRDVRSYEQLKHELEAEYLSKRSTAHLQLEFKGILESSVLLTKRNYFSDT